MIDEEVLAYTLPTRSNHVFSIMKIKNKKRWSEADDSKLIGLAAQFNEKHWRDISENFDNKNPLQCFSRYKRIRPGIVKGSWSKEEDEQIVQLVNTFGKSWSKIAKFMSTRNGKQIRDRFINVLDPAIKKGKFSEAEDKKLIELFYKYGSRWSTISKFFPDRTADMIKNRFHSSIKRVLNRSNGTVTGTETELAKDDFTVVSSMDRVSMDQLSTTNIGDSNLSHFEMDTKNTSPQLENVNIINNDNYLERNDFGLDFLNNDLFTYNTQLEASSDNFDHYNIDNFFSF